ncbi:MAG: transketolase [Candidatus Gastranaerophilales bacterium]|nr:transketolase [Candidatus Gastranaerophilales bacterium]
MKHLTNLIRQDILKMIHNAKSGHPGGSLSCVDILTVLYKKVLNVPIEWDKSPNFKQRDRFILSKGHASPALYATLANCGYFSKDLLMGFRMLGSKLQGHPSSRVNLPGIEVSTGSLGQGLSIGIGLALAMRLDKIKSKVFVLLGDGEMQEGSVWEGLMNANHQKLNNLVVIVDKNKLQIDGSTDDVKSLEPLDEKLKAFGFEVSTIDGHNYEEIEKALLNAKKSDKLCAIIANTIKGKGVSFMENNVSWHGKAPKDNELKDALEELNADK